jgi:hypothetical protein
MIPGGNPKSSKNRNNNVSSTTDGTEKSVSTEDLIARLHKMDELHKMKEDLSFSRPADSIARSDNTSTAYVQYAQRLADRVSSLNPEEIRVIIDDVSSNAPNQSIYDVMMELYGNVINEEFISWTCQLLERRGHHTILSSVLSNCKEGYDSRGFYQRYSYGFGADAREMLFIAANMPDLATWSYHAVTNLQLADTGKMESCYCRKHIVALQMIHSMLCRKHHPNQSIEREVSSMWELLS